MPLILRDPRDPPVRKDGLCVVCEHERKPGQKREPHYSTAQADPFCSAECAREWYGVEIPSTRYSLSGRDPNYRRQGPHSFRPWRQ